MDQNKVLKGPIVTEKSRLDQARGLYTFAVGDKASKNQIKKALEEAFGVDILRIRTVNLKGKKRRQGRHTYKTSRGKKAIVQVKPGQKIEAFGVQTTSEEPPAKKSKKKKEER